MARETAAERKIRKQNEKAAYQAAEQLRVEQFRREYPAEMVRLIAESVNLNTTETEVVLVDENPYDPYTNVPYDDVRAYVKIKFRNLQSAWFNTRVDHREVFLPLLAEQVTEEEIEYVREAINEEVARQSEENRIATLRQSGLAKLSDDEKKALNLR